MRQVTLVYLLKDDTKEICLAMKKNGFGAGKFNGVGGKVREGESIEAAAVREAQEEIGVIVAESDLIKVAELHFVSQNRSDAEFKCYTFCARQWTGELVESEEMSPQWFSQDTMPFEKMWISDKYWLPRVLGGEYVDAHFEFTEDGSEIVRQELSATPRAV